MGLIISHNAWNGSYHKFNAFRNMLASLIGIPWEFMQFNTTPKDAGLTLYFLQVIIKQSNTSDDIKKMLFENIDSAFPLSWEAFTYDDLFILLLHSDCDGEITWSNARILANRLKQLLSRIPEQWQQVTYQFIAGCELAHQKQESLHFG